MDRFTKILNGLLTIFPKRSILDVWQGYEYASGCYIVSCFENFARKISLIFILDSVLFFLFVEWSDDKPSYTWLQNFNTSLFNLFNFLPTSIYYWC